MPREYENTRRQEIDIITPIENDAKRRHPFRFRVPKKDGQNDRARFTDPPTAGTMAKPNRTEQEQNPKIQTTNSIDIDRSSDDLQSRAEHEPIGQI